MHAPTATRRFSRLSAPSPLDRSDTTATSRQAHRAWRAVLKTVHAPDVPWWRVVRADGTLAAGAEQERRLRQRRSFSRHRSGTRRFLRLITSLYWLHVYCCRRDGERARPPAAGCGRVARRGPGRAVSRAICDRAGVQAPTLYTTSAVRTACLTACCVMGSGRSSPPAARPARPARTMIRSRRSVRAGTCVRFGLENPNFYILIYGRARPGQPCGVVADVERMILATLRSAARQRRLRIAPEQAARQILAASTGVVLTLITDPADEVDLALSDQVRDAILDALATTPRRGASRPVPAPSPRRPSRWPPRSGGPRGAQRWRSEPDARVAAPPQRDAKPPVTTGGPRSPDRRFDAGLPRSRTRSSAVNPVPATITRSCCRTCHGRTDRRFVNIQSRSL